jgi:hypothetical protein
MPNAQQQRLSNAISSAATLLVSAQQEATGVASNRPARHMMIAGILYFLRAHYEDPKTFRYTGWKIFVPYFLT